MLGAKKLGYSPGPSILKVKVECDTSWLYRYHTCGYLVNSNDTIGGAAIAQWICLCLPPCRPGFEFQAYHLCFFHFLLYLSCEKNENKQKEGGFGIFKKWHNSRRWDSGGANWSPCRNVEWSSSHQKREFLSFELKRRNLLLFCPYFASSVTKLGYFWNGFWPYSVTNLAQKLYIFVLF